MMDKTAVRLVGAVLLAALAFAALSLDQTFRLEIAALVGVPAFVLMIISRRQLGESFSVMPEAKALVTKGLYSRIQHPLYLFLDLVVLAVAVAVGWSPLLVIFAILIIGQTIQSRREERVLASAFGADYVNYQEQTWF